VSSVSDASDESEALAAGDFSAWLTEVRDALRGAHDADVPCNGCTACCTSSQFIPIAPNETDTIAHIPKALLFPAPRMPGHYVLGYDERGHCPMLVDDVCTIYDHRPRTCRTYDCRVLAAAEVTLDDETKTAIAERVARWRFSHPTAEDERQQQAVRDAAAFLGDVIPSDPTQRAVYAIELYEEFMDGSTPADPDAVRLRISSASRGSATASRANPPRQP
jgi:Fe-S-cluster containining protein